jgi:hypothetical protein
MTTEIVVGMIGILTSVGLALKATAIYFVKRLEHYQERTEKSLAECEQKHEKCDQDNREMSIRLARIEAKLT